MLNSRNRSIAIWLERRFLYSETFMELSADNHFFRPSWLTSMTNATAFHHGGPETGWTETSRLDVSSALDFGIEFASLFVDQVVATSWLGYRHTGNPGLPGQHAPLLLWKAQTYRCPGGSIPAILRSCRTTENVQYFSAKKTASESDYGDAWSK